MSPRRLGRQLRVYAFDPGFGRRLETLTANIVTVTVPAADLPKSDLMKSLSSAGPCGEYLEVVDVDPASGVIYAPVDLNSDALLAQGGLEPDEADPAFHQQMVYAVAMSTIGQFERALGRRMLWSPRKEYGENGKFKAAHFVGRLRIYPHALREANAYYHPDKKALLFGYFPVGECHPTLPDGATLFTCLSHDVIVHETTHALLDGLHPRWREAGEAESLALHEGFADIVAIFQRFTYPDLLAEQIARARGDLGAETMLAKLAQEFGEALGRGGALRDALGEPDRDGVWRRRPASREAFRKAKGPHARGAILVAAVFDAFVAIYATNTQDLMRIAARDGEERPRGRLSPELIGRLATEASRAAGRVLEICIRALDYCPPVDVTIGDYLRAIVTADHDLFPADERRYRVSFLSAFAAWGLTPPGLPIYTERTILWPEMKEVEHSTREGRERFAQRFRGLVRSPQEALSAFAAGHRDRERSGSGGDMQSKADSLEQQSEALARQVLGVHEGKRISRAQVQAVVSMNLLDLGLDADRELIWRTQNLYGQLFWALVHRKEFRERLPLIGLTLDAGAPATVSRSRATGLPSIEAHSVRVARRLGDHDQIEREYVVELLQRRRGFLDPDRQAEADRGGLDGDEVEQDFWFRRGVTLLIDSETFEIRRVIRTPGDISDDGLLERRREALLGVANRPVDTFRIGRDLGLHRGVSIARMHRHFLEH